MDERADKVSDLLGRMNLSETDKKSIKLGGAQTLIGKREDPQVMAEKPIPGTLAWLGLVPYEEN